MASGTNHAYILSLVALGFFLATGFLYVFGLGGVGVFDVLEARLASISSQASSLRAALVVPALNTIPQLDIPPLLTGLQYLAYSLFGETPFAARLPSALALFLTVFIFYNSVWLLTQERRYALLTAATFALSPGALIAARLATPDALFTLFTLSATLMLVGNIYLRERSYLRLFVVGLIMGFGFLVGGIWAVVLPFFVGFLLAILKDHRGYNIASLAPFSVLLAAFLAIFPWMMAVLQDAGPETLKSSLFSLSHLGEFTATGPGAAWWVMPLALCLLTMPWVLFVLPSLLPNIARFFKGIDNPDPREALPALALVWLFMGLGGVTLVTIWPGVSLPQHILMLVLWLSAPVALLVADFFDRLPQHHLGLHWFGLLFLLAVGLAAVFFWLPQMADILQGDETYNTLYQMFEAIGLNLQVQDPFWRSVLAVESDWGLTPVVMGALLLVALLMGGYLMRHGAMEGVLFAYVGMWFVLFFGAQGLTAHVYDHLQQPLKWMSVKIKKEHEQKPARVVLYGIERPSVGYITGLRTYQARRPASAFRASSLPLFVLTDVRHMPALEPHIPAGASHECFGGYCLVELYR